MVIFLIFFQVEELAESLGEFPYFPLHTQTVERAVKGTTKASTTSWSWHSRHNAIVVKADCRAKRPRSDTKRDLK